MRIILTLIFVFSSLLLHAQKGIFNSGTIDKITYSDTLKIEICDLGILVNTKIGNAEYKFFLDTGAPTVIGSSVKGNFEILKEDEISDASNNIETVKYLTIPEINIGNLSFYNFSAMQYDISGLKEFGVDGILGANLMAKSIWDFDLRNNQIIVSNKVNRELKKDANQVKLKLLATGSPIANITHFEEEKEAIYIDLGFNGLYSLTNTTYEKLREKKLIKTYISGEGEFSQTAFGKNDSIFHQVKLNSKIGTLDLPEYLADVDYDEESSIGSEILKYYRVILDFKKKRMYFIPYGNQMPTKFKSFGIQTSKNTDSMYISFIWFTSKAYDLGIRSQDKILSINGINTENVGNLSKETLDEIEALFSDEKDIRLELNTKGNYFNLSKEYLIK